MSQTRRFAVAGTGHRAQMYVGALMSEHAAAGPLVGWCEPNPARAAVYNDLVARATGEPADIPRYDPADLERMIVEQRVDVLIVTAPDHTHADLVVRALRAGADVVVEKPLTISAEGCRAIVAAVEETGRSLVMTFNYRYAPRNSSLREVIASGEIGEVTSVHFEWALDTVHGADYFRRWHREKRNSGGLLIHKSSHHFDLVNWWLQDAPRRVYASGGLKFYGPDGAGAPQAGPRPARGSEAAPGDRWSIDLRADPRLKALYLDAEQHDGYRRDQDPFAPGITIEDNLSVLVDYASGATLTYSLNAHSPWEGYRVTVNGTRGRAELEVVERGSVEYDADGRAVVDPSARPEAWAGDEVRPFGERLVIQRHWERAREVTIPEGIGGHGGGDAILLRDVFVGSGEDPLGRRAGYLDGVRAVAVGIAGNLSLESGGPVLVENLNLGADLDPNGPRTPAGARKAG